MARIKITEPGVKQYYNDSGHLHREDGPAWISPHGAKIWYRNGQVDSSIEPPIIGSCGDMVWYFEGSPGRLHGPANDEPNGHKLWILNWKNKWPELK